MMMDHSERKMQFENTSLLSGLPKENNKTKCSKWFYGIAIGAIALWLAFTWYPSTTVPTSLPSPPKSAPLPGPETKPSMDTPLSVQPPPFSTGQHPIHPALTTLSSPYPTNQWFTNLFISDSIGQHTGEGPITAMPYTFSSSNEGLAVSYGNTRRHVTNISIDETFHSDMILSKVGGFDTRKVIDFDPLSVTLAFQGHEGQTVMRSSIFRGSPYATVTYLEPAQPTIATNGSFLTIDGQAPDLESMWTGSTFQLALEVAGGSQLWQVYFSAPVSLELLNATTLRTREEFRGTVRLAFVPSVKSWTTSSMNDLTNQTTRMIPHLDILTRLNEHASVIPLCATLEYGVLDNQVVHVNFTWTTSLANASLLMLAHPHQIQNMKNAANNLIVFPAHMKTLKGPATFVIGSQWHMTRSFDVPGFDSKIPQDPEHRQAIVEALRQDMTYVPSKTDPYFFGKEVTRQARLVLISDVMNETKIRDHVLDQVESLLTPWFEGSNVDAFTYDPVWGGLCSKKGLEGIFYMTDFGNGWYSDHHFHYGYLIYSVAVLGKYRPEFLSHHREAILALVRDIGNPSSKDPYFPLARHFSWFDGHSFASGVFVLDGGKSQESVSEAINAYYSIYLLGLSMNSSQLVDFGQILMVQEMQAAEMYWQMSSEPDQVMIYEPEYARNGMTGQVDSTKTVYTTWFGTEIEKIHLINMIPFTPITEVFLSRAFMTQEVHLLKLQALDRLEPAITPEWRGYLCLAHAMVDQTQAWNDLHNISRFDDGNSRTNALYWIATRS